MTDVCHICGTGLISFPQCPKCDIDDPSDSIVELIRRAENAEQRAKRLTEELAVMTKERDTFRNALATSEANCRSLKQEYSDERRASAIEQQWADKAESEGLPYGTY